MTRLDAAAWDRNSEGAWRATWLDPRGFYITRRFYGYTKREAIRLVAAERRAA